MNLWLVVVLACIYLGVMGFLVKKIENIEDNNVFDE